jgi:hypothetical protein
VDAVFAMAAVFVFAMLRNCVFHVPFGRCVCVLRALVSCGLLRSLRFFCIQPVRVPSSALFSF